MENNFTKKFNDLLVYTYFGAFLLYSVLPSFTSFYSEYSLLIELTILIFILVLNRKKIRVDAVEKILIIALMGFSLFSVFFTGGGLGSFLNLLHFLIGILVFSSIPLRKKGRKRLQIICGIIWVFNLVLSPAAWLLYKNGEALYNPNTIGIAIFFTSTVLVNYLKLDNRRSIAILLLVISAYGTILSQCRSALVAEVVYFVLVYVPIFRPIITKIKNLALYIITILGVLFPVLYTKLYATHASFDLLYSSKNFFTGRQIIWSQMLEVLDTDKINYLTGLGTKNTLSSGDTISNYHNWYLGMLYTFGIPTILLYFIIFIRVVRKITSYNILCAVLCLMAIGFFETVALFGLTQTYIFIYLLIGCDKKMEGNI